MKKIMFLILFFGVLCCSIPVLAAPFYYYPKEYQITIHNMDKESIDSIELIYDTGCGFNYTDNPEWRYWIEGTDFGYQYKDSKDADVIPKLSTKQIDEIARLYLNSDTASKINGYWIDGKEIPGMHGSINKFTINENTKIYYDNQDIVVSYSADEDNFAYINKMVLRIQMKDQDVVYSPTISSQYIYIVDEYSTEEDIKIAEEVENTTAVFEIDYSKDKNQLDVKEIEAPEKKEDDLHKKDQMGDSKNVSLLIGEGVLILGVLFGIIFLLVCKRRKPEKVVK
ncbi:MAG: hypothetical protein IKF71_05095 [Bacilli bacterium]|nr:hypothetical protein [Bacilli bacterium]